jgi:hypothetical protein
MSAMKDCFGVAGLPTLPTLGDLAKDSQNWKVMWRIPVGADNGYFSLNKNTFDSQLVMKMNPEGDHSSSVIGIVDLTPQKQNSRKGLKKETDLMAEASLLTADTELPSLNTIINAIRGALGDAFALADVLTEIAAGWIQEMFKPKAYAVLTLIYYEKGSDGGGEWTGTVTYEASLNTTIPENQDGTRTIVSSKHYSFTFDKPDASASSENSYVLNGTGNGSFHLSDVHKHPCTSAVEAHGAQDNIQARLTLSFSKAEKDGTMHYNFFAPTVSIPYETTTTKSGKACGITGTDGPNKVTSPSDVNVANLLGDGTYDPKKDGNVIQGSKSFPDMTRNNATVTWKFTKKAK